MMQKSWEAHLLAFFLVLDAPEMGLIAVRITAMTTLVVDTCLIELCSARAREIFSEWMCVM